jgi:hypothetical protein
MFIGQVFFYSKLNSVIQKAIKHSDENAFNIAFKNLLQHAYFSIGVAAFSLLFGVADLFFTLKYSF